MSDVHDHDGEHDGAEQPPFMRRIRSFVLREGRMTPAQQRAFDDHWARFGIDYSGTSQDFASRFGRAAPLVLEIGFGNGEALAWASEHDLARDFLGVESGRLAYLAGRMGKRRYADPSSPLAGLI